MAVFAVFVISKIEESEVMSLPLVSTRVFVTEQLPVKVTPLELLIVRLLQEDGRPVPVICAAFPM